MRSSRWSMMACVGLACVITILPNRSIPGGPTTAPDDSSYVQVGPTFINVGKILYATCQGDELVVVLADGESGRLRLVGRDAVVMRNWLAARASTAPGSPVLGPQGLANSPGPPGLGPQPRDRRLSQPFSGNLDHRP